MSAEEALVKLKHLSVVGKLVSELDNHLALSDKDLAEFIIGIADECQTLPVR